MKSLFFLFIFIPKVRQNATNLERNKKQPEYKTTRIHEATTVLRIMWKGEKLNLTDGDP